MRQIHKNFAVIPLKLQTCFAEKAADLLEKGSKHKFDGACYNKAIFEDLDALYHGKCAFCESKPTKPITIEHYRPKSIYFWLGYEWSNLFFACADCNGKKDIKFLISNSKNKVNAPPLLANLTLDFEKCRADSPELLAEQAAFLHPELDNPLEFLRFEADGKLYAIAESKRANYTIDELRLNRPDLTIHKNGRKRVLDDLRNEFEIQIGLFLKYHNTDFFDDFVALAFFSILDKVAKSDEKREFTFVYTVLWRDYDVFFVDYFANKLGEEIGKVVAYAKELYIKRYITP
jgi:uncharacterized protein (TIGR02646 family)